jgi:protein-tyrosine phosphatase
MIDLHCHILPYLDDGPCDLSQALEMARIAVEDGITDIVATPHTENGLYKNSREDVLKAIGNFQGVLNQEGIPLAIHAGSEIHIHCDLVEHVKNSLLLSVCDHRKYILLELPSVFLPRFTDQLLHELKLSDITPIIAHPERYEAVRNHPDRLAKWMEQGAVVQLNAGSLLGHMGKKTKEFALYLLQRGLVHVLASDGHNSERRRPILADAYRYAAKATSVEAALLLKENAKAVLRGEMCSVLK